MLLKLLMFTMSTEQGILYINYLLHWRKSWSYFFYYFYFRFTLPVGGIRCLPGYFSDTGYEPCSSETTLLPSGRVLHLDIGQRGTYTGSGNNLSDMSGQGNHLYWVTATASPGFDTFNGFTILRTTPLIPYLRPLISTTYNGMRTGVLCFTVF